MTKQESQKKKWCFTHNNYTEEQIIEWKTKLEIIAVKYVFQREVGENGTPHLQGGVWLKKPMRPSEFGFSWRWNIVHWESMKDENATIAYCTKKDTSVGEPIIKGIPKPLKVISELREWQRILKDMLLGDNIDDRTIHWMWDNGKSGKSHFVKYMYVKHGACYVSGGRGADLLYAVKSFIEERGEITILLVDLPRDVGNNVCIEALEQISNGLIFSPKYESGAIAFNRPHIMVFANMPPRIESMTNDRWNIFNNNEGTKPDVVELKDDIYDAN